MLLTSLLLSSLVSIEQKVIRWWFPSKRTVLRDLSWSECLWFPAIMYFICSIRCTVAPSPVWGTNHRASETPAWSIYSILLNESGRVSRLFYGRFTTRHADNRPSLRSMNRSCVHFISWNRRDFVLPVLLAWVSSFLYLLRHAFIVAN